MPKSLSSGGKKILSPSAVDPSLPSDESGSNSRNRAQGSPAKENQKPVAEAMDEESPKRASRVRACKVVSAQSRHSAPASEAATKRAAETFASPPAKFAREEAELPSKNSRQKASSSNFCFECGQALDSVIKYRGHPPDSVEECVMLTHSKLVIEISSDDASVLHNDLPQLKITCFAVHDEPGHLCPFHTDLIEKGIPLFFSGYVKPICDDDPSAEGGVAAHGLGPIYEWYITGLDGGQIVIGLATDCAEYTLMAPAEYYAPVMQKVNDQLFYCQLVLSFLISQPDASYDDLFNMAESATKPDHTPASTEEMLDYAAFIVNQVKLYDDDEKVEPPLSSSDCIKTIKEMAGIAESENKALDRGQRRERNRKPKVAGSKPKVAGSPAATTPLVESVIGSSLRCQSDASNLSASLTSLTFSRNDDSKKPCGKCRGCTQKADCGECDVCKTRGNSKGSRKKTMCTSRRCIKLGAADLESAAECTDDTDNMAVSVGDFVMMVTGAIVMVRHMWEDKEQCWFHAQHFCKASETILSEVADTKEVFLVNKCSDEDMSCIRKKVKLVFKKAPSSWNMLGGEDDRTFASGGDEDFFCHKRYEQSYARFEDISFNDLRPDMESCSGCQAKRVEEENNKVIVVGNAVNKNDVTSYPTLRYKGREYSVGFCCYLDPEKSSGLCQLQVKKKEKQAKCREEVDCKKYPEAYRKSDRAKDSCDDCPEPFRIARILEIFSEATAASAIKLRVTPFYRPEDICESMESCLPDDLNLLYSSQEEYVVAADALSGVCSIKYMEDPSEEERMKYFLSGHDQFYFSQMFDAKKRSFKKVPTKDREPRIVVATEELLKSHIFGEDGIGKATPKLRTMDVFAGCGGLSEGLLQSGVVSAQWAIELDASAATSYALNHPSCTVFTDDCNELLRLVLSGTYKNAKNQQLPGKGEVDFLCGGPPCQGFSGLNRFNTTLYSKLKNSLIASYLSYCDFYRPRFFLLENVRNFVNFNESIVLKLTLQCLLRMGYQCTFGILQAGCYGVPQSRLRVFIFAAAPGEKLPSFPEPLHIFSRQSVRTSAKIDNQKYQPNITRQNSAPYRQTTVRDAISDLPVIKEGTSLETQAYKSDPLTHFQRLIRGSCKNVRDHVCKEQSALNSARIRHIPKEPGADWRDLPNIRVRLTEDKETELLRYDFRDSEGKKRGVCPCAEGKPCDGSYRQNDTLIPWCLPHTSQRHNNWAGLYGRLDWNGFFATTVTCPTPMGKQGRVLHPDQDRVVSVREMARAQGFPDSFKFHGDFVQRYCQIGNAVPPPLARELGHEIRKCLLWKETDEGQRAVQAAADPRE